MTAVPRLGVVVTAGGHGRRLGLDGPKQYVSIGGIAMLARTLSTLQGCPAVAALAVVVNPEDVAFCRDEVVPAECDKVLAVVGGGTERALSVREGLRALEPCGPFDLLGVHDGARPFVAGEDVDAAVERLADPSVDGAVVAVPSTDTVKLVDADGVIVETPPRARVWRAQTPQIFRADVLLAAYGRPEAELLAATDDASLVEAGGARVVVSPGSVQNLKVTEPWDLAVAEIIAARLDGEIS